MEHHNDHTYQVEKRVIAIPIKARDSCGFFEVRENALISRRECFFCTYGKFEDMANVTNPDGFCKFKK